MRRRYVVLITAVIALALAGIAIAGQQKNFSVHLKGANEVPAVVTNAQGQAIFKLSKDGTELSYKLIVANIEDVFASHIHLGAPGVNGPVEVTLFVGAPAGPVNGPIAQGVITDADLASLASLEELLERLGDGTAYVNVHTTAVPSGEIRGNF